MREALQNLRSGKAIATAEMTSNSSTQVNSQAGSTGAVTCSDCGGELEATHYYMRFKPANVDQLIDLEQAGFNLFFEPLDENAAMGYQIPNTADVPWVYTAVPTSTSLPQNIQQEVLEELYLFNEDDGDVKDQDPWEPGEDPNDDIPCYAWDDGCQCFKQYPCFGSSAVAGKQLAASNEQERNTNSKSKHKKRNRTKEATAKLHQMGIAPAALYNEAMRITGNEGEVVLNKSSSLSQPAAISTASGGGATPQATQLTRYYPSGNIRVERNLGGAAGSGVNVPLRRVDVLARRWFKTDHAYTDANGRFYINTGYRDEAKLIVQFKTERATTRGFNNSMQMWDVVLPIRHQMGSYNKTQMQNMNYTFTYNSYPETKGALSWTAATVFNTMYDMYEYAASTGIPTPPHGINVWLVSNFTKGAATPMLRTIAQTSIISNFLNYILPPTAGIIKQVLQRQLPDITCRYGVDNVTRFTYDLDETFFHELGHATHYGQVGNNYWTSYISYIIGASGTYGQKTDNGAGRIAISEAWGYYLGYTFAATKYDVPNSSLASSYRYQLENQVPNNNVDDFNGWVVYGMLHDMTDNGENTNFTHVIDNVNSYIIPQIFRGLQSDIVSVRQYQQRILTQNNSRQAPELEQLVTSYLW